jgi:hypothetical protein
MVVSTGCVGAGIENPTGDCPAPGNGDIACYSVTGPDLEWVLDCDHPLERTYWHVYATRDPVTAAMLPRPDAAGLAFGLCDDPDLGALFERNHLCEPSLDAAGVEAVNAMTLEDALAISHALHERLEFRAVQAGDRWEIAPWPLPEDLEVACAAEVCGEYLDAVCGGTDVGVLLTLDEAQATDLAASLNQAYGIE